MDYTITLTDDLDSEVAHEVAEVNAAKVDRQAPDVTAAELVQRHAETHWAQRLQVTQRAALERVMAGAGSTLLALVRLPPETQQAILAVVQNEIEKGRG